MPDIVLTTQNAKYAHASLGLRYLWANLGPLGARAVLVEGTIQERPADLVEQILAHAPRIVGIGVYIWNARLALEVVQVLKRVAPEVVVVLGGPEVSYETDAQAIASLADYVVLGEGESAFRKLCEQLLAGERPATKVIPGGLPDLATMELPYALYSDTDLRERVVYVEASRGCPFSCEFCLSALDTKVRAFDLDRFLAAMDDLWRRGLRNFKFVDRTFNLSPKTSRAILEFFLERYEPGAFAHFEMIPDRLPEPLREIIGRFPAGALQFEIGVQTFDAATSQHISRHQDDDKLRDNFAYLIDHTGVHVHADLIVGLPGEDLPTFARGFDRLLALRPHEIQVGILKRLRGTPIIRHTDAFAMVYSDEPPYEILKNRDLDFATVQRLKRFAKLWDSFYNSGNFRRALPLLWTADPEPRSPFAEFLAFTDWLTARTGRTHALGLDRLVELLFGYLTQERGVPLDVVRDALVDDHVRLGRRPHPILESKLQPVRNPLPVGVPKRQARHLAGTGPS